MVVRAVVLFMPVRFECVGAISPPLTMWKRAVDEIWQVCLFVSVPVLPTAKRVRTKVALPVFRQGGKGWCDGALDGG